MNREVIICRWRG